MVPASPLPPTRKNVPHRSLTYRRCKCPVWVFGSLDGKRIRKSLDTQSRERAEEILRGLDNDDLPGKMTVGAATGRFVEDCKSRHLAKETVGKYELLAKELKAAFSGRDIKGISADELATYREGWKLLEKDGSCRPLPPGKSSSV
jgi:hypothetical protein